MAAGVVCPGDVLCAAADAAAGPGTHVAGPNICASFIGTLRQAPADPASKLQKPVVEVVRRGLQQGTPKPGDVVTARVTRINPRLASLDILCVGDLPLDTTFTGVIRVQDVRLTEIDKVEIHNCFRPGDIVKAEVLSLGDQRSYYLGTAKNELGVAYAKHPASGTPMVPVSWQEMRCPKTRAVEKRKVAKLA